MAQQPTSPGSLPPRPLCEFVFIATYRWGNWGPWRLSTQKLVECRKGIKPASEATATEDTRGCSRRFPGRQVRSRRPWKRRARRSGAAREARGAPSSRCWPPVTPAGSLAGAWEEKPPPSFRPVSPTIAHSQALPACLQFPEVIGAFEGRVFTDQSRVRSRWRGQGRNDASFPGGAAEI